MNISNITPESIRANEHLEFIPELYELKDIIENNAGHINQNVLDHVILVYESLIRFLKIPSISTDKRESLSNYLDTKLDKKNFEDLLKIATLLHDIAKTKTCTYKNGNSSNPSHEILGAEMSKSFFSRFDLSEKEGNYIYKIIQFHGFAWDIVNHIHRTNDFEYYCRMYKQITLDTALPTSILLLADFHGSDLNKNEPDSFAILVNITNKLIEACL